MASGGRIRNPLRAIFDIRRRELPLALLMFGYFFPVITSFWILKPLKKSDCRASSKTSPVVNSPG